jgi:signal transduction histidine kinase
MLVAGRSGGQPYTTAERAAIRTLAQQTSLTIENAQLREQARRRAMHLDVAARVGRQLIMLQDLDHLLAETVEVIRASFGYYHVNILLLDASGKRLTLRQASGPSSELIKSRGLQLQVGIDGITGWVAHTGRCLLCNDTSAEPRYLVEELLPETKSELAVPLLLRGRILGVLDVQSDKANSFYDQDIMALQLVADQVAIAIENARLFQETKSRLAEMRALHDVSLDIISQLDLSEVLDTLLRRATRLVQAEGGVICAWDEQTQLIRNVAQHNTWRKLDGLTLHRGEGLLGYVVETGQPLIVSDYGEWPRALKDFLPTEQPVIMAVPLKWRSQVIGALAVLNQAGGHSFTLQDQIVLTALADLATIALKNAELYTQVKSFNRTLEDQVALRTSELVQARQQTLEKAEQVQGLLSRTIQIQDKERARIARDLHDSVTQLTIGAMLELQAAKSDLDGNSRADAREKIEMARELLKQIEREIRQAIYDLRPVLLDEGGLQAALVRYAASFQELLNIKCEVRVLGTPARLPSQVEVDVFRIVQEALQNVIAHAHATSVKVTLDFQSKQLLVTVLDDGVGFDVDATSQHRRTHLGLTSMRERALAHRGQLTIRSEPGRGTRVTVQLPNNFTQPALTGKPSDSLR